MSKGTLKGNTGDMYNPTTINDQIDSISVPVVGDSQVVEILIDDIPCKGLLDTGSQVCTIAEWFFDQHLQSSDLVTVEELLDLRQVSGEPVEYCGILPVDLKFPDLHSNRIFSVPVLVMKNTNFNHEVPILIGTNVLSSCLNCIKQETGEQNVKKLDVSTPWKIVFQCLQYIEKKSLDRVRQVYSTKSVELAPETSVTLHGLTRVKTPGNTLVVTEPNVVHRLPDGLVLLPSLQKVDFSAGSSNRIPVLIRNLTSKRVTIPAKSVICNLQEATPVDSVVDSSTPDEKH